MEGESGEIIGECLCDVAERIPEKKTTVFRKVRDTVILAALAGGAYVANTTPLRWQERVALTGLSAAGAIGVMSSYVEKHRARSR